MIYLIIGTDNYQKTKRLIELKGLFPKNDFNVSVFDGEANFNKIKAEAEILPFLSEKKQVIINNLSKVKDKKTQADASDWLSNLPNFLGIVLYEENITEKNWLYTTSKKFAKIETYNLLRPYEISSWIKKTVTDKGGQIDSLSAEKLAASIGNDLWRLDNEIQKLLTYDNVITLDNINNLVVGDFSETVFALMDALSEKKEIKALSLLNNFLSDEDNALYLQTMIARQVRNLLSIKELSSEGSSEKDIASNLKLHPFVVKNTLKQTKNFTTKQLLEIHGLLVEADYKLKTSQEDSKLVLTRLMHQLCL
ncbi:MAG: DNA polymerase III subunit delta [Patescibacteria group bacterium]